MRDADPPLRHQVMKLQRLILLMMLLIWIIVLLSGSLLVLTLVRL